MAKKAKISDLIPDDKNFNLGSEFGNSLIEKSFRKFGAGRSILIDKNNKIIAGNKSIENAAAIGMEDLQIVESDGKRIIAVKRTDIDLDTPEGREMALADNASAKANIIFDAELIEAELGEAILEEYGIENSNNLSAQEDDYEIPDEIETDIVLGDLFEIGQHKLLCGDSTKTDDVVKLMNGQKADMVFTDPPYSVKYGNDEQRHLLGGRLSSKNSKQKIIGDDLSVKEISEILWKPSFKLMYEYAKDDCSFYMTMCQGGDQMMMMMMSEHWQVKHELIWVKSSPVFSMGRLDYDYKHEPIIFGWKKKHNFYGKGQFIKSVWDIPKPSKSDDHPTMKPIALMNNALLNSSKENDIIIDFFIGSGSTMVAAHQLNRKCYGIEIDPKYCQVIIDRMLKLDPSLIIKKNGVAL